MQIEEIVRKLSQYDATFPERALIAARENWSQLVPIVNAAFDAAVGKERLSDAEESFLFWSVLLIGDRKEKDCFDSLIRFIDQDDTEYSPLECVLGDALTENLPNIVAIAANRRTEPLNKLLLSSKAGEYVKVGMLRVLKHMVVNEELTTEYFAEHAPLWIESFIANQDIFALSVLGEMLIDFKLSSFKPIYVDLAKQDNLEPGMLQKSEIERWSFDTNADKRIDNFGSFDIMTVQYWASFLGDDKWNAMFNPFTALIDKPYIADTTPGRNDPCICGSGKKYKKCCLN
ncbi:DUF1186 domain-containing protein [Vibrio vulnificus]|nr:DUF1186 domain-containing protein [Vibrio vulnificus]EJN6713596.1 DUF1186 domain-containing protein [Vibrio vulnificus]